jgi:hypothetical protein
MSGTRKTRIVWQKLDCLNSNPDLVKLGRPSEKRLIPMSRYAPVESADASNLQIVKEHPTGVNKGMNRVPNRC